MGNRNILAFYVLENSMGCFLNDFHRGKPRLNHTSLSKFLMQIKGGNFDSESSDQSLIKPTI